MFGFWNLVPRLRNRRVPEVSPGGKSGAFLSSITSSLPSRHSHPSPLRLVETDWWFQSHQIVIEVEACVGGPQTLEREEKSWRHLLRLAPGTEGDGVCRTWNWLISLDDNFFLVFDPPTAAR